MLAQAAMRNPRIRAVVRLRNDSIAAVGGCIRGTTCSACSRGSTASRPDTPASGLVRGCGGAPERRHALHDRARQPDAFAAEHGSWPRSYAGASLVIAPCGSCRPARSIFMRVSGTGRAPSRSSPQGRLHGQCASTSRSSSASSLRRRSSCRSNGAKRRRSPHLFGPAARGATAPDCRAVRGQTGLGGPRRLLRGPDTHARKDWFS